MPNWCNSMLKVSIESEESNTSADTEEKNELLQNFISDNSQGNNFKLAMMVTPPPAGLLDTDQMDWRISNWGTKWDVRDGTPLVLNEESNEVEVRFSTAWAPPITWVEKVSSLYPRLTFRIWFDESGGDFAGLAVIKQGEHNLCEEWEANSTEMLFCEIKSCEKLIDGLSAWERLPGVAEIEPYCPEHQLEKEVIRAISS